MSPTKACSIITTYRKVSVTDQVFSSWPGFNDLPVWSTFSSTARLLEVRQARRHTPKPRAPVEMEPKTFVLARQTPPGCGKSLQQGTEGLGLFVMAKCCPTPRTSLRSNPKQWPRGCSTPRIQGNAGIHRHNSIAGSSGYFLLLFGFVFLPYMLQLLPEVCTYNLNNTGCWHCVTTQFPHRSYTPPQIVICPVLCPTDVTETIQLGLW